MNTIEKLFYGKIVPLERPRVHSASFDETYAALCKCENDLLQRLSADDQRLFEQCMEYANTLSSMTECDGFTHGFRLGARFVFDILSDESLD